MYIDVAKLIIMKVILLAGIFALFLSCKSDLKKEIEKPYQLKIAYNVLYDDKTDNYEVFIMDLDGSNKQNITNLSGVEWTYYAFEDNVYFISDKDTTHRVYFLYKMKPDGSNKVKITDFRLADSWHGSRNKGSELVIRPHKTIDTALYIIDSLGKVINKLKPDLEYMNDPLFSPDGKQIVFRGGNKSSKFERGFDDELYIMNDDGSNLKKITQFPENDTLKKWYNYSAGPPRWNSNENFISYQSVQNGKYSLFAVKPDGSRQWKLTNNDFYEGWHDWSPDGKYVAIEIFDKDQTQFHIALMNWETKETKILTDSTYKFQQAPVFVKVYD